ncbi:alpha-(1,3)-fucosyltransferase 4-like [Myxocyprinus asiaticus]|uniref:alpha-(1,3)-fucosyltransferase 4-like n=1 Tax=Myxocyprinus asiaticus TaxID=70543 RepID=UPI002223AF91|nr:alpha-(1,3)-fucosyltransferase 4-like [Myxocyprinus asiaticus]
MWTDVKSHRCTRKSANGPLNGAYRQKQCRVVLLSQRSYRCVFALALGCALLLFVLSLINSPLPPLDDPTHGEVTPGVTLLIWWRPFGNRDPLPDCAVSYGIQGCTITTKRSAYARADAVIIHHRDLMRNWSALPRAPRPPRQKWIWMNFESPTYSGWLHGLDGVFNLTMSYHRGSDVFLPYGYLQPRRGDGGAPQLSALHRRKRGLVAWVISNWDEHHERVRFYRNLQRYIRVDVFGRATTTRDLISDSVVRTVSRYKFYLAFENSLHTDYITEKLWRNALLSGAVPVVLGPPRENYELFLPADAFIHVKDFSGPRALASYLKHLDRNPALYQRYLSWTRHYSVHVTSFWAEHYCMACRAVQASRDQNKVVSDLALWFES